MRILKLLLVLSCSLLWAVEQNSMESKKIIYGSWNIRWQSDGDSENGDSWFKRIEPISRVIRFYDFDIVGIQEGSKKKNAELIPYLDDYEIVRYEEKEENPILLKKGVFKVLDKGRFYLSEKPRKESKSWDSKRIRYCTWVKLEFENFRFFVFNTHFDYHGKQAKVESSKLFPKMVEEIAKDEPFIIAGDFNSTETSEAYANLAQSKNWTDARYKADFSHQPRNSYNYFDPQKYSPWDLDHIFVNQHMHVVRYGVLNEMYYDGEKFRFPSDHLPLFMSFQIVKNKTY